jgi:hypothetical protein
MPHVRDLLDGHEAELLAQLKELRESMIPLERELADVRRARAAVASAAQGPEQAQIEFPDIAPPRAVRNYLQHVRGMYALINVEPESPYKALTIKDLVRKALAEQFEFGATARADSIQFGS